ncbi:MAG: DUF302 domain-containing protein [Gammaproteobacteria bacterium]|nr:DUF302 domain-containing protein [Gammaproteobacteria bacterium]
MIKKILITLALLPLSASLFAAEGVINVPSKHSVEQTANKLEKVLLSKGMKIFQRVKHSEGAKSVGININPTELIIFGNPKAGSPLMKCAPTVAIDLPQKAVIWQDANSKVWISYNDPAYLKQRHNIQGCDKVLTKVSGILSKLTGAAAK